MLTFAWRLDKVRKGIESAISALVPFWSGGNRLLLGPKRMAINTNYRRVYVCENVTVLRRRLHRNQLARNRTFRPDRVTIYFPQNYPCSLTFSPDQKDLRAPAADDVLLLKKRTCRFIWKQDWRSLELNRFFKAALFLTRRPQ